MIEDNFLSTPSTKSFVFLLHQDLSLLVPNNTKPGEYADFLDIREEKVRNEMLPALNDPVLKIHFRLPSGCHLLIL